MRRLLAFILVVTLWFNFAPKASAVESVAGLTPCSETPAFVAKSKNFLNTTDDSQSGAKRAALYSNALCGPEGNPHLIVDGRLSHMGDFSIPSILFLYIAGWIGWVGRAYLIAIRDTKDAEMQEVVINVPLAVSKMMTGFAWPALAFGEFTSGKLLAKDNEITVSPR
jgi:photosystem I subunit III